MSSVLRPQGPKKAAVYWRRRIMVLLVVLAVPLTVAFVVWGGSDGGTQAGASGTSSDSQSPGNEDPSPDSTAGPNSSPSPGASSSADPAAPGCQDSDIAVVVAVDHEVYEAGVNPQITMTIRNTSESDCLRDIGSGANEISISSGGHHVWSSDDCDPSQASNEQVLPSGGEAAVTVVWERKLSAPGCSGGAGDAQPGSYQAEGRNGSVVSDPVRLVLQ